MQASLAVATMTGIEDIPQISYWSTAQALDSVSRYPRFMRSIPTDDAVSYTVCEFWAAELAVQYAAVVYMNDEYGAGFAQSISKHCATAGMLDVSTISFEVADANSIDQAARRASTQSLKARG